MLADEIKRNSQRSQSSTLRIVSFVSMGVAVLPEPNFPVKPDEFIGRQVHLNTFADELQSSVRTGRMASFAVLGDWGIGKSSLLLKLASTCSDSIPRMLPVTFSISKDISDYLRFAEALCDRLADALLASEALTTRVRAEIENGKLTRVSVGAIAIDRKPKQYFLSSGSALLRHALSEAWNHFIRPGIRAQFSFLTTCIISPRQLYKTPH
jgi:hypothetical protein